MLGLGIKVWADGAEEENHLVGKKSSSYFRHEYSRYTVMLGTGLFTKMVCVTASLKNANFLTSYVFFND